MSLEGGNSGASCVAILVWKPSILKHFISFFILLIGLDLQYDDKLKDDSGNPCFISGVKGKGFKSDVLLKFFKAFFFLLYIFIWI